MFCRRKISVELLRHVWHQPVSVCCCYSFDCVNLKERKKATYVEFLPENKNALFAQVSSFRESLIKSRSKRIQKLTGTISLRSCCKLSGMVAPTSASCEPRTSSSSAVLTRSDTTYNHTTGWSNEQTRMFVLVSQGRRFHTKVFCVVRCACCDVHCPFVQGTKDNARKRMVAFSNASSPWCEKALNLCPIIRNYLVGVCKPNRPTILVCAYWCQAHILPR